MGASRGTSSAVVPPRGPSAGEQADVLGVPEGTLVLPDTPLVDRVEVLTTSAPALLPAALPSTLSVVLPPAQAAAQQHEQVLPPEEATERPVAASGLVTSHPGGAGARDGALDRHARLVCSVLGVPAAVVSLVSRRLQLFPGAVGLPEPWQSTRLADLSRSSCQQVVASGRPLAVRDAREDPALREDAVVTDLGAVGYLGAPLRGPKGEAIGALAALSPEPRDWTRREVALLADLAAACSAELQLRRALSDAAEVRAAAESARDEATTAQMRAVGERRDAEIAAARSRLLLDLSQAVSRAREAEEVAASVVAAVRTGLGAQLAAVALHERGSGALRYVASERSRPGVHPGAAAPAGPAAGQVAPAMETTPPVDELAERFGDPIDVPQGALVAAREARLVFSPDAATAAATATSAVPVLVGVEATVHAPLLVEGQCLGVLTVGWSAPRTLLTAERDLVTALADAAAHAVQRCLSLRAEREAARTLQRAMLTDLPALPHLELAARYAPAAAGHQVGGDWYDALRHPDGSTLLVIGDVTGHDIGAAAAMGQVRSALRTLAVATEDSPAQLLARLDGTLDVLGADLLATVLAIRLTDDGHGQGDLRLRWSSAGHLPALMAVPGAGVVALDGHEADLLLGLAPGSPRSEAEVELPAGSTLLLYTDGLVERRDSDLGEGVERLADALAGVAHLPLPDMLDALLVELVGVGGSDDVAMLAARTR
ncbi:GAF domain-containing SpoIIE family protein phosphatase [Quadrisphaera granulorum]|uniref:GAF domain-containing SpoIIE family protein phosphatase n=1 Tax=Quadrisphaera granulorum TaxID=317664 RepID=UPI001473C23F|nr:GAF domain-containing SpoIIE family protein phosphatase [Quadrisphaera granulorum]